MHGDIYIWVIPPKKLLRARHYITTIYSTTLCDRQKRAYPTPDEMQFIGCIEALLYIKYIKASSSFI